MTTYFITRHRGALQWADTHQVKFDKHLDHLASFDILKTGDIVIGTLPVNIVSQINAMGVRYIHLSLQIPSHLRGIELDINQLRACQATLEEFLVTEVGNIM